MGILMPCPARRTATNGPARPPSWMPAEPAHPAYPFDPLRIVPCRLGPAHALRWACDGSASAGVIYGAGGGCRLDVGDGLATVWIPLRGALQVVTGYCDRPLVARDVVITDCSTSARAHGRTSARWLAIVGAMRTWHRLLDGTAAIDRQLLPEQYRADRTLTRHAIALLRAASLSERAAALHALAGLIADLQAPRYAAISRCPGRTYAQRCQVFVRLQRVRMFMAASCERDLDNDTLARMASYSSHHFLRTFKSVYLETPHVYLVKQRLQRAQRLLGQNRLAITEIALASGFENPSAFSRLFHQRFGITAKVARLRFRASTLR